MKEITPKSKDVEEQDDSWVPLTRMINFEKRFWPTVFTLFSIRFTIACTFNHKTFHPDEVWQGFEMAY